MLRVRTLLIAWCLVGPLAILPAGAQAGRPPQGEAPPNEAPPPPQRPRRRFIDDFWAANTPHDGHLTLQQARAAAGTVPYMSAVVRHFAQIDVQHKGYITLQDIRAYVQRRRAARVAARQGQK